MILMETDFEIEYGICRMLILGTFTSESRRSAIYKRCVLYFLVHVGPKESYPSFSLTNARHPFLFFVYRKFSNYHGSSRKRGKERVTLVFQEGPFLARLFFFFSLVFDFVVHLSQCLTSVECTTVKY